MSDTNLKKMAVKLQAVASKKQLDSKDMALLREIKDSLGLVLQGLKECDCCGAAVTEIARLELDGVRAAVCQACGIKALKNKSLVIKNVKKKEATKHDSPRSRHDSAAKSHAPAAAHHAPAARHAAKPHEHKSADHKKPFKTEQPVARAATSEPEQRSLFAGSSEKAERPAEKENVFEDIAKAINSKAMTVKKIHQIATAIAFPMNLDRTVSYVRMEAQGQGINMSNEELRKMISLLIERAGVKVKE